MPLQSLTKMINEVIDEASREGVPRDYLGDMLETCCVRCDIRDRCDVAFDPYNIDCEPEIDCLAAK